MGGVDYLDSKVAVYRITIRSKKWWWAHFINTLDCLKAASYMVDKLANPNEKHIVFGVYSQNCYQLPSKTRRSSSTATDSESCYMERRQ